ncbi:MAG: EAL domain-containing protein [Eubacterium sp.]|nr:EAL domain-containing protein [Eubacterium sp.]
MLVQEYIAHYSLVGDICTMLLCVVLMIIICSNLSFSEDIGLKLHKISIVLVFFAGLFNICYSQFVKYEEQMDAMIFLMRMGYHVLLTIVLFLFLSYLRKLLALEGKQDKVMFFMQTVLLMLGILFNVISPLTHWGLYRSGEGLWFDMVRTSPFVISYLLNAVLMVIMLFHNRNQLITSVRTCLVMIGVLCIFTSTIPNIYYGGTFTTLTFLFPMIALLIMIHSLPYEFETGARYALALEHYLKRAHYKQMKIQFMVLKLYVEHDRGIPKELGRIMYSFYRNYVRGATLFKIGYNTYILGVPDDKQKGDTAAIIQELVEVQFPPQYKKFRIPYRIMTLESIGYIENVRNLEEVMAFFENRMKLNESIYLDEEKMQRLQKMNYVLEQLREIHNNLDLNDERILCYMQPVKNVATGEFDSAEALMRMKLPELGLIYPDKFIPLAEQNGFVHSLGLIMLNKVCLFIKELEQSGIELERVSINFTMHDLQQEHFVEEVIGIIAQNHVSFDKIAIEITESQTTTEFELALDRIEQLRAYGIVFYLDDFGTGYTNFERVLRMNLDIVKFDRTLLLSVDENENNAFILHHFAEAFEQLDYKILFEGIETTEQEKICCNAHADYLQGYMYSKPMPAEDFVDFLNSENKL